MTWSEDETASSIPARFESLVQRQPDRPAVLAGPGTLTYADLHALAGRYARAILDRGGDDLERVPVAAVLLPHGGEQIAAVLGALRCGLSVTAINPNDPPARVAQIRAGLRPRLLLTDEGHAEAVQAAGFDPERTLVGAGQSTGPEAPVGAGAPAPDDLAFVISTSGSSGRPKLVMQSHRNMLHNVLRYSNGLGVGAGDRIAWLASLSGGQGLATSLTALLNGAALCPFPIMERGVTGLGEWLVEQEVTVFDTVPSVLRNFARTLRAERFPGVRLVRLASEAGLRLDFEACQRHFEPDCVLASVLASSEAGIMAQALLALGEEPPPGRLTVGTPAEGIELLLLDETDQPVEPGETGEVVVKSRYLALGYWHDPALTKLRFEGSDGERRFRTGDLAQRSASGALTVVGRSDAQVKVRGYRLQLEEVESALAAQPGVAAAAVLAGTTPRGDTRLTAYLTARPGHSVDTAALRRSVRTVLPPYAVPAEIVPVESLPLTPHGKVDRARLSELESSASGTATAKRAATETEELVLGLWRHAFERDDLELDDAFLDLGGDSLTAAVLAAEVHQTFGVELELGVFASEVTVASMAELLARETQGAGGETQGAGDDELPLRPRGAPPASFAQRWMWLVDQRHRELLTMVRAYRLRGSLDVDALRRSVAQIVRRHEILRTTFAEEDGRLVQLVQPAPLDGLAFDDLRSEADPEGRAAEIQAAETHRPFDLQLGPLLRLRLLRLSDQEHRLLRASHHLITDALSWRIFFDELAAFYQAELEGSPAPLPAVAPLQYADYAAWEWARMTGPKSARYEAEIDWWQRTLQPAPEPLKLPFRRSAVPDDQPPPDSGLIEWELPAEGAQALDRIGREAGATYFMTRLATFAALLLLDSAADDALIEIFVSSRRRAELQPMIGLFINRAFLRLHLAGEPSFVDWLASVRDAVTETSAHATIPDLRRTAQLHRRKVPSPTVEVKFGVSHDLASMRFGGLEVEALARGPKAPSMFTLEVARQADTDRCRADFDPQIHDPEQVSRFVARLQALTTAVCAEPQTSLRQLHRSLPNPGPVAPSADDDDAGPAPQGILYSATGESFLADALASARSSRRFNPIPHLISTDQAGESVEPRESVEPGVQLRVREAGANPYADKIRAMIDSPFERTIYLDADTYVLDEITELFTVLDHYDLIACHAPGYRGLDDPEVPRAFYELHTGLIAWRRNEATAAFLADWLATYERWCDQPPFENAGDDAGYADQPAFRNCAWRHGLKLCVVGFEYCYRTPQCGHVADRVRVLHGRQRDFEQIAEIMNREQRARVFPRGTFAGM